MMCLSDTSQSVMKGTAMSDLSTSLPKATVRFSLAKAGRSLAHALMLHRSRQRLMHLDSRLLDDVGLTPGQARDEASRPVWDAPETWRQKS